MVGPTDISGRVRALKQITVLFDAAFNRYNGRPLNHCRYRRRCRYLALSILATFVTERTTCKEMVMTIAAEVNWDTW